jgi:hypothetical protein
VCSPANRLLHRSNDQREKDSIRAKEINYEYKEIEGWPRDGVGEYAWWVY